MTYSIVTIMSDTNEVFLNQVLELRRGSIVLAIVGILRVKKHYGYSLLRALEQYNFPVDGSTLYPLLRRLEKQEMLSSEWDTTDKRPRKYYSLTTSGEKLYQSLLSEWREMNEKINEIVKEDI